MIGVTRAAVFTDNDFAKVNGVTTVLSALLRHAPATVAPRIYTVAGDEVIRPDYLALRAPGMGIPFYHEMKIYAPRVRALGAHARADGIDVVHLTTPGPVGLAALHVASRLRVPLIGSFHTDLGSYIRMLSGSARFERWVRRYLRWMYGRCERILAPSAATGAMLADDGIDPARIAVWTRGVDAETFSPACRSEALRASWGLERASGGLSPLALLYAGRVSKEKELTLLPGVASRLRAAGVRHRWIIVGDGPYRVELQRCLNDAVFVGTLGHAEVARPMASADLFVFPSCTDTAGNVVLEAQACGLPVIVSDQGGPRENMRPEVTGLVCRGGRADDLADAIIRLASHRGRREPMAAAARRYALGRRWDQALAPLYDAYRTVSAARRTSRVAAPGSAGVLRQSARATGRATGRRIG